jgi:hypothetical protein
MPLRLLRESAWARVFETDFGDYYDSKFRTGECEASGAQWAEAWLSADDDERIELEAAFVFMQDEREVSEALERVGERDPGKRRELGSRWVGPEDEHSERHRWFLDAYREALEGGDPDLPVRSEVVLEATWFRVVRTLLGVEIEPKVAADALVSASEFFRERDEHSLERVRHLYDVWWEVHRRGRGRPTDGYGR